MNNYKGLLLGAVAASVFAAGAMITPAHAGGHSDGSAAIGHKNGAFYVKSKDGNYTAMTGVKFQFDSTTASLDDGFAAVPDSHAFDVARLFFGVKGRAGSPNLTYGLLFNVEGGAIIDSQVSYKFNPMAIVRVGNFKSLGISAGNRQSSSSGWMVDGPNGFGDIASGRNVGISLRGKYAKVLSYEAKISQGGASGVETGTEGIQADFGLSYEPFGRYGAFNQPDYSAKNKLRVLINAGYVGAWQSVGDGDFATYAAATDGDANLDYWHTLIGMKYAGLSLTAAYEHAIMQTGENDIGANANGRRTYAYMLAASYMVVPKKIPLALTYSVKDPDSEAQVGGDNNGGGADALALGIQRQVGVGAAYLFNGHKNKLHASWDRISTDVATTAINGNETNNVDHSFKVRWQVLF
jgi:hypothetical protein